MIVKTNIRKHMKEPVFLIGGTLEALWILMEIHHIYALNVKKRSTNGLRVI